MATFTPKDRVRGNLPLPEKSVEERGVVTFSKLCNFQPKQLEATEKSDLYQYFLYGGTRGPGKSYWLRWHLLRMLLKLAGQGIRNATVGLFCEDYPSLTERQTNKIAAEFPEWLGRLRETKAKGFGFHLHPTYGGGFLALRNLDDPSKYQSAEFAGIGIDEITKNEEKTFDILRGSLRWRGVKKPRFCACTNPGGIGHSWVKRLWVDRDFPERYEKLKDEFYFLAALPDDNKYLDESYWDMLESLPDGLKAAWRYGEWDIFEGQFFSEFRRDKHVLDDYEMKPSFSTIAGLDYGSITALEVIQMDYEGTVVVADECYIPDATNPTERANIIADFLIEHSLYGITIVYDTDMEISQISNVGFDKTPIQIFRQVFKERMGRQAPAMICATKKSADRDKSYRQACNEAVKNYLNTKNGAIPKLYFSKKAKELLLEITEKIIYDEKDPDSLDYLNRGVSKPHCFIGETLVATSEGDKRIDEIKIGDKVLTRQGFKPVAQIHVTENAYVNYYPKLGVTCTPNHKFFTNEDGFIPISDLKHSNTFCTLSTKNYLRELWKEHTSNLRVSDIIEGKINILDRSMPRILHTFIVKFGKMLMEKFPKIIKFITKMAINSIILLKILKLLIELSIFPTMQNFIAKITRLKLKSICKKFARLLLHGTKLKKLRLSIQSLQRKVGRILSPNMIASVSFADQNINHIDLHQSFARRIVTRRSKEIGRREKVYNLGVEDVHEYYVSGTNRYLVSNCYDAFKYAFMEINRPIKQKPKVKVSSRSINLSSDGSLTDFNVL